MASGRLDTFIRRLRRVVGPRTAGGQTDAELLERFVRERDQTAFEVLVWRHGAMVLTVCLRVLRREHDAEDAFQAAFLALARKAGSIGNRASLGSWLYKVAYRVALRARAAARPRPLPEEPLPDASAREPITDLLYRELRSALDEEVDRLPDKYRIAFVLCHLEGRTTEAAARAMGCPQGTVGARLARARELLRRRLARRGFDLSALTASRNVVAAPPAALVDSTLKAALFGTADKAAAAGVISARAAALTKGALRTMSLTKWTLTTAVVLALGLLGGGAVLLARPAPAGAPAPSAALSPPADPKDSSVALQWRFEKDKPFYQELVAETHQTLKVQNNDVVQDQRQTFTFRWTPERQDKNGDWVLTQKIDGVKTDIDVGGSKIEFDSTKETNTDNALSEFYKALVGAEFRVTLDAGYRVREVEGRDEVARKIDRAVPAASRLLAQVLTNDAVSRLSETAFAALPGSSVRPGDSWTRTTKLTGGAADLQAAYTYTYEGREGDRKEGDLDRIKVEITLKDPSPAQEGAGLPFKVKNIDLKCAEGAGVVLFDRDKGRVVRQELTVKLEGKVTVVIGGQETEVELRQTQKTTLRTTDANPLSSAAPSDDKKEIERLREENERLRRQLRAVEEALHGESKPKE